jgi:hypothetical protein
MKVFKTRTSAFFSCGFVAALGQMFAIVDPLRVVLPFLIGGVLGLFVH